MTSMDPSDLKPRAELERKREVRAAWGAVALGVLIPAVALFGLWQGARLRREQGGGYALLMIVAVVVFLVRAISYWAGWWPAR